MKTENLTTKSKRPVDFDITMEEGRRFDSDDRSLSERRKEAEVALLKSGQTRVKSALDLLD